MPADALGQLTFDALFALPAVQAPAPVGPYLFRGYLLLERRTIWGLARVRLRACGGPTREVCEQELERVAREYGAGPSVIVGQEVVEKSSG